MHLLKTTYFVLLSHHNVPNVTLPRVLHRPGPASRGRVRHVASLTLSQYICIELRRFGPVFAPDPILHISPGPVRTM